MPSPPHEKGGAFQNVAKQQCREGWVPFWGQEIYFRLFFSLLLLLTFLFSFWLSVPLDLSGCPLHSGVHCHTAFGLLSIKNFYLQRVHKSILEIGLYEAVLSGKDRTIWWRSHTNTHQLLYFSAFRYFPLKACQPPKLTQSALLASVHSGAPNANVTLNMLGEGCQSDVMVPNSEADMPFALGLLQQWFPA